MSEEIILTDTKDRETLYQELIPQIEALISDESEAVANLANSAAALKEAFGFLWVGFYKVVDDELVLGPFQGPVACTRIKKGKGVCGTAWIKKSTIIVDDVDKFPGHIACSSMSRSEIVVPISQNGKVKYVLDVDSDVLNDFNETDKIYLEELAVILSGQI